MSNKANETEVIPKCARVECQTLRAELEDTQAAASIHADEHRKARREIEALRAQLDDAKDLLRDAGFLLIPNAPKHSHRICIFLAKLEELEKCDKEKT